MKTNKIIITILLAFIFSRSYSQSYFPLLKNTEWHVKFFSFNEWDVWHYPDIDTVVNSKVYKKYYTSSSLGGGPFVSLLREDTVQRKVWIIKSSDSTEYLLYDFSLGVGGKYAINIQNVGGSDTVVVTQIDSVMTTLGYRKRFQCLTQKPIPNHIVEIIESVGSTEEPLQIRNYFQDPGSMLVCSKQNNIKTYQSIYYSCKPRLLATEIISSEEAEQFALFPNPNNGAVSFKYAIRRNDIGVIRIIDLTGKLIEEQTLNSNNNTLQLTNSLQNGIYLYQVIVNNKIVKSNKLVVIE